jgi:hydrogenase-4 component E
MILDEIIRLVFVLILADVAFMITRRNINSLFILYSAQSFLISLVAVFIYLEEPNQVLLLIAFLTVLSKTVIIPLFMHKIQKSIGIRQDVEFRYLSPVSSIFASIFLMLLTYTVFSDILAELSPDRQFLLGAVIGISLIFMGMLIMLSRKKAIIKTLGYLTMENGVLVFGLFLSELPFIIEILIAIDLIMIVVLSTLFAFGVDSTIEEFHARLRPLSWFKEEKE